MKPTVGYAVLFMALCAAPSVSLGQGVGGNSPTYTIHSLTPVEITIPENPVQWRGEVGSASAPIGVQMEWTGPMWTTEFQRSDSRLLRAGHVIQIEEYLTVQGDSPWTGWNMEIGTDSFAWWSPTWGYVKTDSGAWASGLQRASNGSSMDFTFDPLSPGTRVQVVVRLRYDGALPYDGTLQLVQCPVPEPTSFLLIAFSVVFCATYRR